MIVLFFIAHYITIFRGMSSILWKKILRVGDPKSHESQLDRGTFHRISGADGNATAHLNLAVDQDPTAKPEVSYVSYVSDREPIDPNYPLVHGNSHIPGRWALLN